MTTNHCLNPLRKRKRRRQLIDETVARAVDTGVGPDHEAVLTLRWLLANAGARQARVSVYVHLDGVQQSQVADLMGITERTVRNLLRRFETWADEQLAGRRMG